MKKTGGALLISFAFCVSIFAQGALAPPAAPGPTMKTLNQVEARTIVNAANTPGTQNTLFQITASGSYYLTGNITGVSGKSGITITANNVTLDLNGFAVTGVSGASHGIDLNAAKYVCIGNGSVRNWPGVGIWGSKDIINQNSQFEHLRVSQNHTGIQVSLGNTLTDVIVEGNSGTGIEVGTASIVTKCSIRNNGTGIFADSFCTVIDCVADGNGSGIFVNDSGTIKDCVVTSSSGNGITVNTRCSILNCVAGGNGSSSASFYGISAGTQSLVKNCVASKNTGDGIFVSGYCSVLENECSNNTVDGIGAAGGANRIEGNHTNFNTGIGIDAGGDWVVRNTSSNNMGGNFVPATGPDIGPIQTASTATNPFANLQ
jgi:parallel beta-helix repeat protein